MAAPDPIAPTIGHRFARAMRFAAALSVVLAALAVVAVSSGQSDVRVHMLIATALGVGLSVLLGTALMTLIFLSNRHGHDADAHHISAKKDEE